MIKALIVEDEPRTLESLEYMLGRYCPDVTICATASSFDEAYELYLREKPGLLFLDIQLNSQEGTGLDLAALPEIKGCAIIYVSGYKDYAVDAFRQKAVDYLLKPVKINQLVDAVNKAKEHIQLQGLKPLGHAKKHDLFHIPVQQGFVVIRQQEIIRCEADGAYTHFYLKDRGEKHTASINIGQVESRLGMDFMRVHKSHIINRDFILSYSKNEGLIVKMADRYEVPVARTQKDQFFKWLQ